jgi:hypothetical protein
MARWDDWDYGEPENRPAAVERHLNRIGLSLKLGNTTKLGETAEPVEVTERKAREAKERLARHDQLFGLDGTLEESLQRVSRPHYGVGDPDGRDD